MKTHLGNCEAGAASRIFRILIKASNMELFLVEYISSPLIKAFLLLKGNVQIQI